MLTARRTSALAVLLSVAFACGDGDGKTGASDGSSSATTGDATQGNSTSGATSGDTSSASSDGTGGGTSGPTTGTTASTTDAPTSTGSGTDGTTGVDVDGFERFRMSAAAGPCPPDSDCDGFVELLGTGTLRVEKFGEIGNPVQEFAVTPEELAAALPVFADPELLALLDGPEPLCNPPTDIFESMLVDIQGTSHDATTTTCDQPPIAAARAMAVMLRDKYAP